MSEGSLKEKAAKGLLWSSIGNGVQLFLGFVFGIFLARMLSPSDYGMAGLLQVFGLISAMLQDSGFRTALANRKEVRHEDYNAVFWFNVSVSVVLYVILFFLAPLITEFYQKSDAASEYDLSELTPLARFAFLGFLIASFGMAPCAYLFRTLQVKQKAIITVTSLVTSNLIGITMVYFGYAYWGLVAQGIAFTTCNTILFWYFSRWRPTWPVSFRPLKEMFGFSCKLLATDVFNVLNGNLLTIVLGRFYSVHEVGIYNQAGKWTNMGSNMITGTVKEVAQPVLRNVSDERERHKRVFRKMLRFTAFVAFPALFGLALIARELTVITVTEKWLESVPLMQILCVGAFVAPIQYLCLNLVITKDRSDLVLWNTVGMGIAQLATVFLSYAYGVYVLVCACTCVNILGLGVWFYFVHREIGLRLREAFSDLFPYAAIAGLVMVATAFITSPISNLYLLFGAKIVVAAVLYVAVMWLCGSATFKECAGYLLKKKGAVEI